MHVTIKTDDGKYDGTYSLLATMGGAKPTLGEQVAIERAIRRGILGQPGDPSWTFGELQSDPGETFSRSDVTTVLIFYSVKRRHLRLEIEEIADFTADEVTLGIDPEEEAEIERLMSEAERVLDPRPGEPGEIDPSDPTAPDAERLEV